VTDDDTAVVLVAVTFTSVTLCLLLAIHFAVELHHMEVHYRNLLCKYTRLRADSEHGLDVEDWVSGHPNLRAGAIRVLNRNARYNVPPDKGKDV
jgi:hypothetical protein